MKSVILYLLFIIALAFQVKVYAQWSDDPKINSILMNMINIRKYDAVLPSNNGGAIVAWIDGQFIYAQRLSANGKKLWKPEGILLAKEGAAHLKIVSDCSGGAIVAWEKDSLNINWRQTSDIYTQRIDSMGNLKWAINGINVCTYPIPCMKQFAISNSVKNVISDGAGGAIITWQDYRIPNGYYFIYGQKINSLGNLMWNPKGISIGVKSGDEPEYYHEIITSGDGGAIVCGRYNDFDRNIHGLYVQKIDNSGTLKWDTNGVPIYINSNYLPMSVRMISDVFQGAFIYWSRGDEYSNSINVQKINSDGIFQWTNDGVSAFNSLGFGIGDNFEDLQNNIVSDCNGGTFLAFSLVSRIGNNSNYDIYAQKISASGIVEWKNNGIPICTADGLQRDCIIKEDGSGGIITSWADHRSNFGGIYAQRVNSSGIIQWQENGIYLCPNSFLDISLPFENEVWIIGTKPIIHWWDRNFPFNVNIELSTNSGTTWTYIKKNIPSDVKDITDWEVPNSPSTKCKIRISDADGYIGISAVSDGFFTIAKPSFNIISPIGGEVWKTGANPVIKWSSLVSTSLVKFVNIDLSTDGGTSWIPIFKNTPNDGKVRDWIVPNLPSSQCKLRISDPTGNYLAVSNGYFTILGPSIQVVSPAGGEVWKAGSNPTLSWKSTALSKFVNIDLSTNGGSSWQQIVGNTPDDGNVRDWIVPNSPSTQCKIRVTDIYGTPSAVSNGFFTILAPSIAVSSPAGGEIWKVGSNPILKWQSSALSKYVNIDLSTNGGTSWQQIVGHTPDDGMVRNWIIPNSPSTQCKIRITDISGSPSAVSNGFFTISKSLNKSVTQIYSDNLPEEFALNQNFPNPFNPETRINYQIPAGTSNSVFVQLKVYDIVGREITTLVNEEQSPGIYQVSFDGSSLPSGVYIYRLLAGDFTSIKKMILTK